MLFFESRWFQIDSDSTCVPPYVGAALLDRLEEVLGPGWADKGGQRRLADAPHGEAAAAGPAGHGRSGGPGPDGEAVQARP